MGIQLSWTLPAKKKKEGRRLPFYAANNWYWEFGAGSP
jgi:hypothetical protein